MKAKTHYNYERKVLVKNKNRWIGTCETCGKKEQSLSTTQSSWGPFNIFHRRSCEYCQSIVRTELHKAVEILIAGARRDERILKTELERIINNADIKEVIRKNDADIEKLIQRNTLLYGDQK